MDKHGLIGLYVLLTMISPMSLQDIEEHSTSACFQQPEKTLLANCTQGHMVKINDIFFGHSSGGKCHRETDSQCIIRDPEMPTCVGHSTCAVNLPTGSLGRKIQHCNQYTNYMQMVYNCIPGDEVVDICSQRQITAQSGYIKSAHYPNNYPATHQCNLTIKALPSQQIRLYAIDLDLGSVAGNGNNGGDCIDLLYIEEQFRSSTVCGKRSNDLIFSTVGNTVTLIFQSNKEGLNKGFWLKFEATAFPNMESTSLPPASLDTTTTERGLTNEKSKITGHETDVSLTALQNSAGDPDNPRKNWKTQTKISKDQGTQVPLESIVGGILGTLFFILLVLLILLIIKRRKDRESMTSSHSTAQLHSSASTKSGVTGSRSFQGTAGPYIQNNLAEQEEGLQGAVGGCDTNFDDEKFKSVQFDDICKKV